MTAHLARHLLLGGVLAIALAKSPLPTAAGAIRGNSATHSVAELPPLPASLPAWLDNRGSNRVFYRRGRYNFAVYGLSPLARDLNAVAVGHAMAYEDLVTGKAERLESDTFARIDYVLKHPPALMPDEAAISPTFGRKFGVLEQVFDWTHTLHAQTVDVLASSHLSPAEKDREIEKLWDHYFRSVPYAVTPLPMNMGFLDGQPYSGAFRKRYPKVNGLFWGYHWLQGAMYDILYRVPADQFRSSYEIVGERYHQMELYRTDRPFMPMFAETSPRFAARFPQIANAFDNLHMLHDMVNDILASDWIPERHKEEQIRRAIWLVSADAHRGEDGGQESRAGGRTGFGGRGSGPSSVSNSNSNSNSKTDGSARLLTPDPALSLTPTTSATASHSITSPPLTPEARTLTTRLHDHRSFAGMPGMGLMRGMTPELMWMPGQGWMSLADCHHCSMPLWDGADQWRNPTVSAEGWTMRVRCPLCARDMAAETKGRAILHIPTENPDQMLVVFSDEQGNLKGSLPGAVFLEQEASHDGCDGWSRAFTSRSAFNDYVAVHREFAGARPLTFAQWAEAQGKKPDTYVRPKGPVENPYAN